MPRLGFFERISSPECESGLRSSTDELVARGGFRSPTNVVGEDTSLGNDRVVPSQDAPSRAG